MYVGVCEGGGGGVRTNFDMVHLQHPPPQFTHLSGLLDLFKSKLVRPSNSSFLYITVGHSVFHSLVIVSIKYCHNEFMVYCDILEVYYDILWYTVVYYGIL